MLPNIDFGFDCLACTWQGQYTFEEFQEVSYYWLRSRKIGDRE